MKNKKFLYTILLFASILVSCDTDGGDSELDLLEGAVADLQKNSSAPAFLDLNELSAGSDLQISVDIAIQYGNISSVDLIGYYRTGADIFGPVTLKSDIKEFPSQVSLTDADIISAFSNLSGKDDFKLADELILSTSLHLKDGRTIDLLDENGNRNYGSDIHSSTFYKAQISYPVSCPSNLAGTYDVVSNGTSTDGQPAAVDLPYTVTITDNGGGSYTISDGVAGVYQYWYCSPYGYCFETEGSFTDICGELTGSWVERFGCQVDLTGTVNPNGTLSIHWVNCFGDEVNTVYTKQ
jgi:hypothetical protein